MVIIYGFLSFVDYIIYSCAAAMFRIIMDIANVQFFTDSQITDVTHRVYVIVGVLMLFKLVISAVQYMINPDMLEDKDKGFSGFLVRTAVSLALIVLIPPLFSLAFQLQKPIVESIPNIIFGTGERVDFKDDTTGNNIAFQVLEAFVPVREGHESKIPSTERIHDIASFQKNVMSGCPAISLFGIFGSYDTCNYNYIIIISTAAGIFMCYVLFVMIMDIAIRSIKFSIIQILAPIPISSYVFNKEKLGKFAKMAVSVYLDLFIRMIVIYFIVFAIEKITSAGILKDIGGGDLFRTIIANVAIIIGLLMFAKNAPKFITDLLGLENVTSDDMKSMFTRAGGLFGATVGAGKSFISSRANARNEALKDAGLTRDELKKKPRKERHEAIKKAMTDYNKKQGFGHGIYGRAFRSAGSAYGTGFYQSYIKGQGYKETFGASDRSGQKSYELDKALVDNKKTHMDYYKEVAKRRVGINSDLDVLNTEIEAGKNASDKSNAALSYVTANAKKFATARYDASTLSSLQSDISVKFGDMYDSATNTLKLGKDKNGKAVTIDLTNDNVMSLLNRVNSIINDTTGLYDDENGEIKNFASGLQDLLEGKSQTYIVSRTKELANAIENHDEEAKKRILSLGFDEVPNPRFMTAIREAEEANIIHIGDTNYGRNVWKKACEKGYMEPKMENGKVVTDAKGDIVYTTTVRADKIGEWIKLNKTEGQIVQDQSIAAKGAQAADAILKNLADKYDKK